jgi:hypothetical protein
MDGHIDLHIHSNKSSDGDFTPAQIVQLAKENNLKAISISDHDTVAAYPKAIFLGKKLDVEIIPSLELTTIFDNREFHLLLPFVDWTSGEVAKLIVQVTKRRFQEAKERVEKLKQLGFKITWEEVLESSAPFPPLGVTIAQLLLKQGEDKGDPSLEKYYTEENVLLAPYIFYKDYFMEGQPAFVPRRNVRLLDVLDVAKETGGVPVLAHPGAAFQQVDGRDIQVLKGRGLEGLEVYTSYHDEEKTRYYKALADEFDLVPTAGSDFHGSIKPHIPFAFLEDGAYWMVVELNRRRP